jgi:hypothetical protein
VSFWDNALSIFKISAKTTGANTENSNVSILRQWLRKNNPNSI